MALDVATVSRIGRPRSAALDALRVAVVALVVVRHTYPGEWVGQSLVFGWSVPFFFVVTGWLWSRGSRSIFDEVGHRLRTLGRPYLAWGSLILVCFAAWLLLTDHFTANALLHPIYGGYFAQRPFTTFWFISVLFFVTIYFRALEANLAIATAVAGAGLVAGYLFGPELARTPLGLGSTIPCLSLILAGYGLRTIADRRHATGVAFVALVPAVVIAFYADPINIKPGDYGTPVVSLAVCCAIIGSLLVLSQTVDVPHRFGTAAAALAPAGFCVILIHPAILWVLHTPETGAPLWHLVAALTLPWIVGLAAARTRLSPWLLGR